MENKPIKMPEREVNLSIGPNSYVVKIPTTGQFIDIQSMKSRLAGKEYDNLSNIYEADKAYAKLLIDMIASFTILIPSFQKDLNVKSIAELDILKVKELMKAYTKVFLPWYNSILEFLGDSSDKESLEESIDEKENSIKENKPIQKPSFQDDPHFEAIDSDEEV